NLIVSVLRFPTQIHCDPTGPRRRSLDLSGFPSRPRKQAPKGYELTRFKACDELQGIDAESELPELATPLAEVGRRTGDEVKGVVLCHVQKTASDRRQVIANTKVH